MCDRCDDLEDALTRIAQWADAYPKDIFHVPTPAELKRAHEVLKANGMTIDALSAYAMRHALMGVGDIAKGALPDYQSKA